MKYKYCPNCGAKIDASAKFCIKCGYHFSNNDILPHDSSSRSFNDTSNPSKSSKQSQQPKSNQDNKSSSSGCGCLICICLMVGILGMILEGLGLPTETWDIIGFAIGILIFVLIKIFG